MAAVLLVRIGGCCALCDDDDDDKDDDIDDDDDVMVVVNVYKRERLLGLCHLNIQRS